jgi:GxxExxY protein
LDPIPVETEVVSLVVSLDPIPAETDLIAGAVVDAGYSVHARLGPGLLERVYEVCLAYELSRRGIAAARQVVLPVVYDNVRLDAGMRLDLLAGERVIVEVKAIEALTEVHTAQMLTYLKLSGLRLGLLLNFNVRLIKDGIRRIAL